MSSPGLRILSRLNADLDSLQLFHISDNIAPTIEAIHLPNFSRSSPANLRAVLQGVFNDGHVHIGRILTVYKFEDDYCFVYPEDRINLRIIVRSLMTTIFKLWICQSVNFFNVNAPNPSSATVA